MISSANNIILEDILGLDYDTLDWKEFREGVTVYPLYQSSETNASAALLHYTAGASVPDHMHTGYEHLLILKGSQEDERGIYKKGDLIINKPFTHHWVKSSEGCVVLAIWEEPVAFI